MTDPIREISPDDVAGVSEIDQRQALIREVLLQLPPDECMAFVRKAANVELQVRDLSKREGEAATARKQVKLRACDAWLMALLAVYAFNVIMEAEHERKNVPAA